ncbi:DNA helicase/exodeoxyribonuclease V, alpha subunit [Candidatus Electrothrix marina]|uniref:DNA helicase/exodeoxyribonuclease V, alpha subunit n=1 Tax=Candidatus Electrothrix marina TaxID=1859130 RepID=A0A444JF40_9BACT|nr:DNA helicase/exodeoxyribonuclease V, alpha subunit [Candidatus Electrothrix marina]
MHKQLQQACDQGEIRLLDLHLGLFLEKQAVSGDKQNTESTGSRSEYPTLLLAATLASAAVGNGHVCYPLGEVPEQPSLAEMVEENCPGPEQWREELLATSVVGQPGEVSPLILDEKNRLYLHRFSCYEEFIATALRRRAATALDLDHQVASQLLARLFPRTEKNSAIDCQNYQDYQQLAAALALLKPLVIISGGPGTGKTHTVARILAAIQALHARQQDEQRGQRKKLLRIALAAPTGKAAARLEESIRKAKLSLPEDLRHDIPEQAQTLHRLLGSRPGAAAFRFNRENPLYLDLLVLDEASMIDVEMMVGILEALPEKTRIILLGDRNQLASVEAGSLFVDLCGNDEPAWSPQLCAALEQLTGTSGLPSSSSGEASDPVLADSLVLLRTSYRFQDNSGIGSFAAAVKSGSVEQVNRAMADDFADVEMVQYTGSKRKQWLENRIRKGFQPMLTASSPEQAFAAMEVFRFLCALRRGPDGVEGINTLVTQVLRRAGLISPQNTEWYQGRPIIILRNQYEMELFNGDTGILWQDEKGRLRAWFRRPDNSLSSISPARLPEHQSAYAITVHKAQGSEFDQVLLLLPEEDSRVLSQELLYTGISRARSRLILCASSERVTTAVRRKTQRFSGLAEKLHG